MNRHQFLTGLHRAYRPRSYLEIGINDGRGLARSSTRTIGVDPEYRIVAELACDLKLVKATSDDFFARPDAISWFPEGVVDLTFVDGLHIFEFALRDFMNAERLSSRHSVIVLDDMLPRTSLEAARDRHTKIWTGDVFKVAQVLERYRPDLVVVPLDTVPTGLVLVAGLDPTSTVLRDHYDEIEAEYATADPQTVPHEVMHRTTAAVPERVLELPLWGQLAAARDGAGDADAAGIAQGLTALRELRGTSQYVLETPPNTPWPPPKPAPPPWTARRVARGIRRRVKQRIRGH